MKYRFYIALLIIICNCVSYQLNAQFHLEEVNINLNRQGIHATNILQDNLGTVWISAYDEGLYRIYGDKSVHYANEPKLGGLCGNSIYSFSIDQKNKLWISTQSCPGACLFNLSLNQFETTPSESDDPFMIYSFYHTTDNTYLGCSDGIYTHSESEGYKRVDSLFIDVNHFYRTNDTVIAAFTQSRYALINVNTNEIFNLNKYNEFEHWTDIPPKQISPYNFIVAKNKVLSQVNVMENFRRELVEFEDYIYYHIQTEDYSIVILRNGTIYAMNRSFIKTKIFKIEEADGITQYFSDFEILQDGTIWFSWNGKIYNLTRSLEIKSIGHPKEANELQNNKPFVLVNQELYKYSDHKLVPIDLELEVIELPVGIIDKDQILKNIFSDGFNTIFLHISKKGSYESEIIEIDLGRNKAKAILTTEAYRTLIQMDPDSNLWISTDRSGIYFIDRKSGKMENLKEHNSGLLENWVNRVVFIEDSAYVGHRTKGLVVLDRFDFSLLNHFEFDSKNQKSISSNYIIEMVADKNKYLWIGTEQGLNRLDLETNELKRWFGSIGLPEAGPIYNLEIDMNDRVWIEMKNDLYVQENLANESLKLPITFGYDFFHSGFIKLLSGELFLTRDKDVLKIDSVAEYEHLKSSNIRILGLNAIDQDKKLHYSKLNSDSTERITIPNEYNTVSIDFFLDNYIEPSKNSYTYQLVNYDENWSEPTSDQSVRFTNLPSGNYKFLVKGKNHLNKWSENIEEFSFSILPPFYWTRKMKIFYLLLFISTFYLVNQFIVNHRLKKAEKRFQTQKLLYKELLYSNITHEFRSPLTVIHGLTSKLQEYVSSKRLDKIKTSLILVQQNTNRLLNLVNQFLDFDRDIEDQINADFCYGDIIPFILYILESFKSMAIDNQQEIVANVSTESVYMDFDKDLIQKIISNLLTNAIKFSPSFTQIFLNIKDLDQSLLIEVRDQGKGISEKDIPRIFDRYFQSDEDFGKGSGIGLALVKEIVTSLNGEISVDSELGKGALMTVILPKTSNAESFYFPQSGSIPKESIYETKNFDVFSKRPSILIADDSRDVVYYLNECLQDQYQLLFARDGAQAMEKAMEFIPDFIISDQLMPHVSGINFIKNLKDNIATSHIPILLLTAKTAEETRIQAYEAGADAFLEKPFNEKELLLRVEKLIEQRNNLRSYFSGQVAKLPIKVEKQENEFVQKLKTLILDNIQDTIDVPFLCKHIAISRTQLHRKIKAITNLSTTELVRKIRIEQAEILLRTSNLTVSEIAYDTGFSSPSYFSRQFSKLYGMSPTGYRDEFQ